MRTIEFKTPTGQRIKVRPDRVDGVGEATNPTGPATWLYMRGGNNLVIAGGIDTVAAALGFDAAPDGPVLRVALAPASTARQTIDDLTARLAGGALPRADKVVHICDEIDPWPGGVDPRASRPSEYERARIAKMKAETALLRAQVEQIRGQVTAIPTEEDAGWFKGPQEFDASRIEPADLAAVRALAHGGTIECPMGFDRTFQARRVFTVRVGDGPSAWQAPIGRETLVDVQRGFGLHWNGRARVAIVPFSGRKFLVAALRVAGHYVREAEPVAQDLAGAA